MRPPRTSTRSMLPAGGSMVTVATGRRHRQVEVNAAMSASGVVVLEVPGQNMPQVLLVPDHRPVHPLGPDGTHPPFGVRVGLRRPGGILTAVMPAAAKTASNAAVNLVSRSRIRNRSRCAWSSRSISRFRAICAIHSPLGCAVIRARTAKRCERIGSSSPLPTALNGANVRDS